jgi:hypothetical protein
MQDTAPAGPWHRRALGEAVRAALFSAVWLVLYLLYGALRGRSVRHSVENWLVIMVLTAVALTVYAAYRGCRSVLRRRRAA